MFKMRAQQKRLAIQPRLKTTKGKHTLVPRTTKSGLLWIGDHAAHAARSRISRISVIFCPKFVFESRSPQRRTGWRIDCYEGRRKDLLRTYWRLAHALKACPSSVRPVWVVRKIMHKGSGENKKKTAWTMRWIIAWNHVSV